MIFVSIDNNGIDSATLTIDEYVPISFRTYSGLLGAKYLRLGNFKTSLLECLLDPHSYAIRGITLLSFDRIHVPNMGVEKLDENSGRLILDLQRSNLTELSLGADYAEVNCAFSVGLARDYLEVDLFGIATADSKVICGQVEFFLRDNALVGIRVTKLMSNEISILQEHISVTERARAGV
jgi:hypothetical protein